MSSKAKVLLVEDELIVASSIAQNLEKAGYLVAGIASSAHEALDAVERTAPDLVLMDIRIKGPVDGVQAAEQIRDRFRIPIIFLTAHSDENTLDRAKLSEPLGYLLKPVSQASLLTGIEVALYKHSINKKLEEHRAWLETILQTSAEAILVTDIEGGIQFLNGAAELLTGLKPSRVRGRMLDKLIFLTSSGTDLSPQQILSHAVQKGSTVLLPHDTMLRREGVELAISGHFAVSKNEAGQTVGGVITLHEVTADRLEEQQIRQEQKMSLIGHFAGGVAEDFNGLLDLISASAQSLQTCLANRPELTKDGEFEQNIAGIQQSAEIAMTMSRLLLNLANHTEHHPDLVKVDDLAQQTFPLLKQLAGPNIELVSDCASDVGAIFGDRNQMEQLLMNLVLNAKERLADRGKIRIVLDNMTTDRSFVRIRVTAEQASDADQAWAALTFPFQMDSPPLSLSLAGAIIAAAEGHICSRTVGEAVNEVEILLPRRDFEKVTRDIRSSSSSHTVLLIGVAADLAATLHRELQQQSYIVFEAKNVREALLILGAYGSDVTAIIVDGPAAAQRQRKSIAAQLSQQQTPAVLFHLSFSPKASVEGWRTLVKPIEAREIIEAIKISKFSAVENKGLAAKTS